jgi:hypothetical protein
VSYQLSGPGPLPTPREMHPAFYGSFDWHSCVEMHWILARLLRLFPRIATATAMREALDENLAAPNLAVEARYIDEHRGFERPYGWGWALRLVGELSGWDDADGRRWRANIEPLATAIRARFLEWLPKQTYALRIGLHGNSAFGLLLSLDYARNEAPELAAAMRDAALRWFTEDTDYPARFEPSGADFLSPALTEAALMRELHDAPRFNEWFARYLPALPRSLLEPAIISDPTDGQIAHLHGLNLSRAFCMRRIAEALPASDARRAALEGSAERHTAASLSAAVGSHYMVEHWLAAYALLLLDD